MPLENQGVQVFKGNSMNHHEIRLLINILMAIRFTSASSRGYNCRLIVCHMLWNLFVLFPLAILIESQNTNVFFFFFSLRDLLYPFICNISKEEVQDCLIWDIKLDCISLKMKDPCELWHLFKVKMSIAVMIKTALKSERIY